MNKIKLMNRLLSFSVLIFFAGQAMATDVVFNLSEFAANPTTNRQVVLQPMSQFPGNLIFLPITGTNGLTTNLSSGVGLFNGYIAAPPGKITFQIYVTATNLGVVDAFSILGTGSASTYPAGQTAWAIATSDSRYQLSGTTLSNTFYPLFSNPSNYSSLVIVTQIVQSIGGNATNGALPVLAGANATVTIVTGTNIVAANSQTNAVVFTNDTTWFDPKNAALNATNPIASKIVAATNSGNIVFTNQILGITNKFASTNDSWWDINGAALNSTNNIGVGSGLSAFVSTNNWDTNGAANWALATATNLINNATNLTFQNGANASGSGNGGVGGALTMASGGKGAGGTGSGGNGGTAYIGVGGNASGVAVGGAGGTVYIATPGAGTTIGNNGTANIGNVVVRVGANLSGDISGATNLPLTGLQSGTLPSGITVPLASNVLTATNLSGGALTQVTNIVNFQTNGLAPTNLLVTGTNSIWTNGLAYWYPTSNPSLFTTQSQVGTSNQNTLTIATNYGIVLTNGLLSTITNIGYASTNGGVVNGPNTNGFFSASGTNAIASIGTNANALALVTNIVQGVSGTGLISATNGTAYSLLIVSNIYLGSTNYIWHSNTIAVIGVEKTGFGADGTFTNFSSSMWTNPLGIWAIQTNGTAANFLSNGIAWETSSQNGGSPISTVWGQTGPGPVSSMFSHIGTVHNYYGELGNGQIVDNNLFSQWRADIITASNNIVNGAQIVTNDSRTFTLSGASIGGNATTATTASNAITSSNLFGGTIYNASTYPTNIYFGTGTIFGTNGMTNVTSTTAGAFSALRLGWDLIVSNSQMKVVGINNPSNIFVMTLNGGIDGGTGFALGATVWQIYPNAIDNRDVNGMYVGGIGNEGGYTHAGYSNGVVSNNGNTTWANGPLNSWVEYTGSDGLHHLRSIRGANFIFDPQAGSYFDFGPIAPSFQATNNIVLYQNGNPSSQCSLFYDNLLGDGACLEAKAGGVSINYRVATLLGNGVSVGTVGVNNNYQCFTPSFSDYSGWTYSSAHGLVFTNQDNTPTLFNVGAISSFKTNAYTTTLLNNTNAYGLWISNYVDLWMNVNVAGTIKSLKIGTAQ